MKTKMLRNVSRNFHKVCFKLKKHSPEILVVAGVTGAVVSAGMACKATIKATKVLENAKHDADNINRLFENEELKNKYDYTEEDHKQDLRVLYIKTGVELVKLYAPSVLLGACSIGSILMSHRILNKRNVALAAAYATVDKSFKEYRDRVIERFGERLDKELKYNLHAKEIEETITDENGKEKTVKKTVDVVNPNDVSQYARFFDEFSRYWKKSPEYNLKFLKSQQAYANDLLELNGMVFLNEVYDMLDIPRTKEGQIVGWVYDKDAPIGENQIDFGIYDIHNEAKRAFVNGYERSILLDFNVQGNVWANM